MIVKTQQTFFIAGLRSQVKYIYIYIYMCGWPCVAWNVALRIAGACEGVVHRWRSPAWCHRAACPRPRRPAGIFHFDIWPFIYFRCWPQFVCLFETRLPDAGWVPCCVLKKIYGCKVPCTTLSRSKNADSIPQSSAFTTVDLPRKVPAVRMGSHLGITSSCGISRRVPQKSAICGGSEATSHTSCSHAAYAAQPAPARPDVWLPSLKTRKYLGGICLSLSHAAWHVQNDFFWSSACLAAVSAAPFISRNM